jgi:hypothetical protein
MESRLDTGIFVFSQKVILNSEKSDENKFSRKFVVTKTFSGKIEFSSKKEIYEYFSRKF